MQHILRFSPSLRCLVYRCLASRLLAIDRQQQVDFELRAAVDFGENRLLLQAHDAVMPLESTIIWYVCERPAITETMRAP